MTHDEHPLDRAARLRPGGREQLARELGVTPSAIGNWKSRGTPVEHCAEIERLCERGVTRIDLRPKDWKRIWPELEALDDHGGLVHVVSVGGNADAVDHHERATQ